MLQLLELEFNSNFGFMKKLFFYIILNSALVILNPFCFAQNAEIDSILTLLKTDKADTSKLIHLNALAWTYDGIGAIGKAMLYADSARQLSIDLIKTRSNPTIKRTAQKNEAYAYRNTGLIFSGQGKFPEALKSFLISLKIYEALSDKVGIANAYLDIGNVYDAQGNYSNALTNYHACLKIMEEIGRKAGVASTLCNIGNVYAEQGKYSEALKNYFASLKIKEEMGDKASEANPYNNIGNVYWYQGKYDTALKYFLISLKIRESIGEKSGIASSYLNIGNAFAKTYKNKEAEYYLDKSEKLSKELGYKENLRNTYYSLAILDSAMENYKAAYKNFKLYFLYNDSLNNEETKRKTVQLQMTYDFDKKEAVTTAEHKKELESQQELSEEKSMKQKVILILVSIFLAIVLVFTGFVSRSLRTTRKQKNIIELQKKEVEQQKHLVEEKQKDIIDSITYAKRLQLAILPSNEELKKYLPENFILYKPKDIVAGDFYWLHVSTSQQGNGNVVYVAAADSTGHGVPGAIVSVVCSNALNRSVNEFNLIDTGKILDKTRELVLETFAKSGEEIKDGMDISILAIDKATKQISWSGANNHLWYFQNSNFVEIKPDKQAIGKTENPLPFTTHLIEFKIGDVFYLITDGYADQFGGPKGKKFKYKQFEELLLSISQEPMEIQKQKLDDAIENWKGDLEQVDDVTVIGIRI